MFQLEEGEDYLLVSELAEYGGSDYLNVRLHTLCHMNSGTYQYVYIHVCQYVCTCAYTVL